MMADDEHNGTALPKVPTAIPGFDHVTEGGLPEHRTTLVSGTSGSAKTVLAVQYLYQGILEYDTPGIFVTFEEPPSDIRRNVRAFGWDLAALEAQNKLAFIDASPLPGEEPIRAGEYDFGALLAWIEHAKEKVGAARAAIDSINALFLQWPDAGVVRRELSRMTAALSRMNLTSVVTAERTDDFGEISRFAVEEFVVDNVIILRNSLEDEKRRRTVEVLKYRGAGHRKGEYPFTITSEGIEVLPLSTMTLTQGSPSERVSTGNLELDEMTGGGFFKGSVCLLSGATGTGKTLEVTTFLNDGSVKGEKTLVFAFEESREQLLRNATGWGMPFSDWEAKGLLRIVCNYPESLGLEDHLLNMKREIEKFEPARIAVDSLSAMERVGSLKSFREFVIGLTSHVKERECTGLFTATTGSLMGGTSVTESHISTITDTILLLRYVELMGEMRRGLTVLKMRGSQHDKRIREFTIDGQGMHIGAAFENVSGILSGIPRHYPDSDPTLEAMFEAGE